MPFTNISTYVYHQNAKHSVTITIKTPHISEDRTIWPRYYNEETRWRNTKEPITAPREIFLANLNIFRHTLILQFPTKQLNPLHALSFDLLTSDIIAEIDIWLSVLEHCDKFKHIILRLKSMFNPDLFTIDHYLWTLYHNFVSFRCYKKVKYDWAHIHILGRYDSYCTLYE